MDESRFRRVDALFHAVLEHDAGERQAYLRDAAGDDSALAREVSLLLRAHERDDSFLDEPAHGGAMRVLELETTGDLQDPVGARLGPWRLTRAIAAGGMGAVYLAERDDDAYHQQVAVKLIRRRRLDHREELGRRFQVERQALANLDHPSIARLIDGGTADDGRPYLVMEYVDGLPIDAWCDQRSPSIRERLELACAVCDAVQHAHQNLVIHRDLKPGNILVTADGGPKLLDFGLAKLLDPHRAAMAGHVTVTDEFMGTFAFAAPEQLTSANAPDTRSDVYALGVILYRILAGRHPYDVTGAMSDVLRRITTVPPAPPSAANPAIDGDLETIILKAMAKDPNRRYQSAGNLREDIGRYLGGRPILARADSGWYMFRKTLRRYRAPLAIAAGFVLLVAASGVVATVLAVRLADQKATLATTLHLSNIERGRAMAAAGNLLLAEQVLWSERAAGVPDPDGLTRWALWELYQDQPCVQSVDPGLDAVEAAAWSSDDRWLAVAGRSGPTLVLDAGTGAVQRRLPAARAFSFRPGTSMLLLAGPDREAAMFDVSSGEAALRLVHDAPVVACAWAASGRFAVTATAGAITTWAADGSPLASVPLSGAAVVSLAVTPDERIVAAGAIDGRFDLVDLDAGIVIASFPGTGRGCYGVAFSPDGRLLATIIDGTSVGIVEVASRRLVARLDDASGWLRAVAFHPGRDDPYWLAAAGFDKTALVWAVSDGGATGTLIRAYKGHNGPVLATAFSADGDRLLTAGSEPPVRFWETTAHAARSAWPESGAVFDVQCTADGRFVLSAVGEADYAVRVRDAGTGAVQGSFVGHSKAVVGLAVSPDGGGVASTGYDGTVVLWDLADPRAGVTRWTTHLVDGHLNGVSWAPDGRVLSVAGDDGVVRLLDAGTGAVNATFDLSCGRIPSMRFSPDGRRIAAAVMSRNSIALIDPRTGGYTELPANEQGVRVLRFSPDGGMLAAAGDDLAIRLWTIRRGEIVEPPAVLAGHQQDIFALAFSPDGALLASSGRDGEIRMWSPRTGRNLLTLPGHRDMVFNLAFTPDGRHLLSASRDGTIGRWDLAYYDTHIEGNRVWATAATARPRHAGDN